MCLPVTRTPIPSPQQERREITLKLSSFSHCLPSYAVPCVCLVVCMWRSRNPCLMRRQKGAAKCADWEREEREEERICSFSCLSLCLLLVSSSPLMAAGHFRSRTSVPPVSLSPHTRFDFLVRLSLGLRCWLLSQECLPGSCVGL